ncbi:hypothetical protein [Lentzea sp. NPDC003310]|uniref:hypothetical protein n=1 Tax=Lentzea sp. NPDC003310 TaxID=3154447 RepID=UPI0033B15F38
MTQAHIEEHEKTSQEMFSDLVARSAAISKGAGWHADWADITVGRQAVNACGVPLDGPCDVITMG